MGKKTFGTILKVAAIVAIAYFAPAVAGKVLATTLGKAAAAKVAASAIGATISSAAAGAAMGEVGGAVGLGTNWQSGALAGGMGGYGKYAAGAANAASAAAPSSLNPLAVTPTGATGSLGATLPGTTVGGASLNSLAVTGTGATGSLGATLGGTTLASAPVAGLNAAGAVTGLGAAPAAAGLGGMLAAAPAGLKTVAPALLAAGLVGSGASAQMKAQQAELDKARASNSAFTQERFNQSQRLLGEADYLNPEYMGRQAGQAALIRGSIQEAEGTRGLTGARREAELRRFRLGTSRNVGTAFQQGFGQGVTGRIQTRQAGINSIPTAYPLTTAEAGNLESQRIEERDKERQGVGLLLGQVLGVPSLTAPAG